MSRPSFYSYTATHFAPLPTLAPAPLPLLRFLRACSAPQESDMLHCISISMEWTNSLDGAVCKLLEGTERDAEQSNIDMCSTCELAAGRAHPDQPYRIGRV